MNKNEFFFSLFTTTVLEGVGWAGVWVWGLVRGGAIFNEFQTHQHAGLTGVNEIQHGLHVHVLDLREL